MRWPRLFVLIGVLIVAGALWLRPGRRPDGDSAPTAALPVAPPSARPMGGRAAAAFAWLGQRGIASRRIAGRVVHRGQPVAHAAVRLATVELHVGEWPLVQVEADGAGRFDLGVQVATHYRVVAQAPGLVAAGETVDLRARDPRPPPDDLTIELRDCDLVVRGTVGDVAGGIISGAHVRVGTYAEEFGTTESDREGRYRLCVSAGPIHVEAGADGYGTVFKHARGRRETVVDFALSPELAIAGHVVDGQGVPVSGAAVVAATNGHDPGAVVDTADDGSFRLKGLAAGSYLVIARAADRVAEKSVTLAAGSPTGDVVLALEPRAVLAGKVTIGGRPAGDATVTVTSVVRPWKLGSAVSQSDGRFSIAGLPRVPVRVSVEGHKLVSPDEKIDLAVVRDVELVCERRASVSGRVVRGGKPGGRAEVEVFRGNGRWRRVATRDDGSFHIDGVAAGSYEIRAESLALGVAAARRPLEVETRDVDGLILELDLAASIAGTVVDTNGAPVEGVSIAFTREKDRGSDVTAPDGTFLVTGLGGGGNYFTEVSPSSDASRRHPAPAGQQLPVVVVADGTTHVTGVRVVILRGDLSISGRVVRGAAPVAGASVVAMLGDGIARTHSGPDGAFVLRELGAGSYDLSVDTGGVREVRIFTIEAGAKDVILELPLVGGIEATLRGFRDAPRITAYRVTGDATSYVPLPSVDVTESRFTITEVPVGTYDLHATAPNGAHGSVLVTVMAGAVARPIVDAGDIGRVAGVVTDWRTGAPIAAATCTSAGVAGAAMSAPVPTDAAGAFAFEAPAGRIRVDCGSPSGMSAREVTADIPPGGSARVAVELIERRFPWPVLVEGRALEPLRIANVNPAVPSSGLRVGDVVVGVDGRSVVDVQGLAVTFLIAGHEPGSPAKVTVVRDGAEMTFDVPVGGE